MPAHPPLVWSDWHANAARELVDINAISGDLDTMEDDITKAVARHLPITGRQAALAFLLPMLAVTGLVSWQLRPTGRVPGEGSWAAALLVGAIVGVSTAVIAWPLAARLLRTAFPRAGLDGAPQRQILVHGSPLPWWWWLGFLPVTLLSFVVGPLFLIYLGVFVFKTARRFVLLELRADGASVRGALDSWEQVSMVRTSDRSLELVTTGWKYALAFDLPASEEVVLWLARVVEARLAMRNGGVTVADNEARRPAPPPTVEGWSDVHPLSLPHAGASLLLALAASTLLTAGLLRLLGLALPSNPRVSVPIVTGVGMVCSMGLGLWKHCARLVGGIFGGPANGPFFRRNISLLHDAASSGAGWTVAVGLSLLGLIGGRRIGSDGAGLWLSHAAAAFAMFQLGAALIRARVIRLSPDSVRVGRAFGRSEVVTDVASYGDSLRLKTERRSWSLRFRADRVGLVADSLASTIRSRIDAGKRRGASVFRVPPAPSTEGADEPTREIERVTTGAPILLRLAVAGWGAGMVSAGLLCWLFDEMMFWAFGAERRSDLPMLAIVCALMAFAGATWRGWAAVLEPLFRKDQLDIGAPSPRRSHILAFDLPVARVGSLVACLVTFLWVAPYSVKDSSLGASDLLSATLSHATVLYVLGYGWLVLRRTRLLWLNRRTVLIGRVYESPLRASSASGDAEGIELVADGRLWRLRVNAHDASRIVARLLEAIRARIGGTPQGDN